MEIKISIGHEYRNRFECDLVTVISKDFDPRDINIRSIGEEFLISFDKEIIEEVKCLEFWLTSSDTDFYSYTQLSGKKNEIVLLSSKSNKSELSSTNIYSGDRCPLGTIGKVKLHSIDLSSEKKYHFEFKTKRTFWEYRIYEESNLYGNFEVIDDYGVYFFEKKVLEDEFIFRSSDPIPYFERAQDRILLKFKQKHQYEVDDEMDAFLPYADFNSTILDNGEATSVIYKFIK